VPQTQYLDVNMLSLPENKSDSITMCGLCEVNGPQVDRALVKGSRRSRCQLNNNSCAHLCLKSIEFPEGMEQF